MNEALEHLLDSEMDLRSKPKSKPNTNGPQNLQQESSSKDKDNKRKYENKIDTEDSAISVKARHLKKRNVGL